MTGKSKICSAAAGLLALGMAFTGSALAATSLSQSAGPAGCITESGAAGLCQDGRGLVGTASLAISPDGESAYVASSSWNSLSILSRDRATGGLAPIANSGGCLDSLEILYPDCTQVRELGGADDVVVSPDGKNIYVASPSDGAVVSFNRDLTTGQLSLPAGSAGCVNQEGTENCAAGRGLGGATSLAASSDGKNVYVASAGAAGGIAIFDREPNSGALTEKSGTAGCINPSGAYGCATGPSQLLSAAGIQISPDGMNVYAVSKARDAVLVFDRAENGELTLKPGAAGCIDEAGEGGCQTGTALIEPVAITVSPDGRNVYVASSRSDAIAIFDRKLTNGELTQKPSPLGCVSNTGASNPMQAGTAGACEDGAALDGVDSIAVPPDGASLYATAAGSSAIAIFERSADGALRQNPGAAGCITDSGYENTALPWTAGYCANGSALIEANSVIASADSKYVYTTALNGGVGIFNVIEPLTPSQSSAGTVRAGAKPGPEIPNCRRERADLQRAQHKLRYQRDAVARLAREAAEARISGPYLRGLRKHRGLVRVWSGQVRNAEQRIHLGCGAR